MSIEFSQELDAPIITPTLTGQDAGEVSLRPKAPGRLHRPGESKRKPLSLH